MKKKSIIFFIAIILAVSITGIIFIMPGNKGSTDAVHRIIGTSALYDEELISKAFDAVESKFSSDFKDCTLTELRYDRTVENKFTDEMLKYNTLHNQKLIIVSSDFETNRKARDLGLIPNETYEGWTWSLKETDTQQAWEVIDGGWGY